MKRSYQMHCLFRSNVGDVKMRPFMSDITNIMRIFGHKICCRVRTGNVEYIMTQKDQKCRYQKCDVYLSTTLEFSCLTRNTIRDARNILQILVAKMHVLVICKRCKNQLITSYSLLLISLGGAKLIVHSIFPLNDLYNVLQLIYKTSTT